MKKLIMVLALSVVVTFGIITWRNDFSNHTGTLICRQTNIDTPARRMLVLEGGRVVQMRYMADGENGLTVPVSDRGGGLSMFIDAGYRCRTQ